MIDLPHIETYDFVGYDTYFDDVMPQLDQLLDTYLHDPDGYYSIAICEAVCNAARYSVDGCDHAHIIIQVYITANDIKTTVKSDTRPWDVETYRDRMMQLADNEILAEMDWGKYTGNTVRSRGFWLMLTACEYLYIDVNGKEVTLCVKWPFADNHISMKIKDLIPKMYLKKNEVIF